MSDVNDTKSVMEMGGVKDMKSHEKCEEIMHD